MAPTPEREELPPPFELEEYKQVLKERHFIMTRYIQAVGLYVTLSGFALKELVDQVPINRVWLLASLFSVLNILALIVARQFRNMADHTMKREMYFVDRYHVQQMYRLFWGYYTGVILVCVSESAILSVLTFKLVAWPI